MEILQLYSGDGDQGSKIQLLTELHDKMEMISNWRTSDYELNVAIQTITTCEKFCTN